MQSHEQFSLNLLQGRNKEKATSTIFLDNDNFSQLPKLVDLLTRDGQTVPPHVLELAQVGQQH